MNLDTTTTTAAKPNMGFGTGKGTTAKIKAIFAADPVNTVKEVAEQLGLPARQLNKRFAELVKSGYLVKNGRLDGSADYSRKVSV